ncbi:MAG TPA: hypothetical protein PLN85_01625 [archaeon]|nr:hypothetical protein [archaeon]HRS53247.1 hypothetical protein [Bacteroidales bacterium]
MKKYGFNIRKDIIKYLKDNLNNKLTELDIKYNLNGINLIKDFNFSLQSFNYPCCMVYIESSKVVDFSETIELITELYDVKIEIIFNESNMNKSLDILDSYEEALKILFNYPKLEGYTYIRYTSLERNFLTLEKQGGNFLGILLNLEILI